MSQEITEKRVVIAQPAGEAGQERPALEDEAPRPKVLEALEESLIQYDELYRRLAQ